MSSTPDLKKYAVLYVDDEEQALKYFRKGLDKDFRVLTANGVLEALMLLDTQADSIGVVITDQRMPGRTGVDLLTEVRQKWPGIVRILITAYADIDSAIASVNSGSIYKYITKPADFNQLRSILTDAMKMHLTRRDRESLLTERVGILKRIVVADRVRSLAALAGGISHHLRNSMTAMNCFLEENADARQPGKPAPALDDELLSLALRERKDLIQIIQRVAQTTVEPVCQFADESGLEELIQMGTAAIAPEIDPKRISAMIPPAGPKLKGDREMLTRMIGTIVRHVARLGIPGGQVHITAEAPVCIWNTTGAQIQVRCDGPSWTEQDVASFFTPFAFPAKDPSDLGLDLLVAFFIAYHHGGDLLVHRGAPQGPGFELRLPFDPQSVTRPELQDHLMEKLFTRPHFDHVVDPAA
jgi:two-component system probable response regulator PhcQ